MEIIRILVDWFGGAIVSLPLVLLFMLLVDKKRFTQKWGWVVLFVLYMNAMLIIIGMPTFAHMAWNPIINWIPFNDFSMTNILGMVLNVAMFIPFGGFLPIYFKQFRKVQTTVVAGFLMSLSIEILQLFTFRATDVNDLIMNTIGAFVGYGIAKIFLKKSKNSEAEDKDRMKLIVMILLIGAVIVFVRYPLVAFLLKLLNL